MIIKENSLKRSLALIIVINAKFILIYMPDFFKHADLLYLMSGRFNQDPEILELFKS